MQKERELNDDNYRLDYITNMNYFLCEFGSSLNSTEV